MHRHEELEELIRAHPDDSRPYLAYADWLQARGEMLGELITVQHALSLPIDPRWALLEQRERELMSSVSLPAVDLATVGWRWGLFEWIRLENSHDWTDANYDPLPTAHELFAAAPCIALQELRFGVQRWEGNHEDVPAIIRAAGEFRWAQGLRRLHLGDTENVDTAHHVVGDVGQAISKSFPRLEWLKIHSGSQSWIEGESFGLGGFALPELRELIIHTCAMSRQRLTDLFAAKWPRLERLELWFGATDHDSDVAVEDLQPLLDGEVFGAATHLGLCNAEFSDELARRVAASPLAQRLETFDLSMGILTQTGAAALIDGAAAFTHLKNLNVSDNFLRPEDIAALKRTFECEVVSESQKEGDEHQGQIYRYVSVHE